MKKVFIFERYDYYGNDRFEVIAVVANSKSEAIVYAEKFDWGGKSRHPELNIYEINVNSARAGVRFKYWRE